MDPRVLGQVDLPPSPLLAEFPDSLTDLDANIRGHPSSIDLVQALYLVHALSGRLRTFELEGLQQFPAIGINQD
jgi:hypothetical protein